MNATSDLLESDHRRPTNLLRVKRRVVSRKTHAPCHWMCGFCRPGSFSRLRTKCFHTIVFQLCFHSFLWRLVVAYSLTHAFSRGNFVGCLFVMPTKNIFSTLWKLTADEFRSELITRPALRVFEFFEAFDSRLCGNGLAST